LNDYVQLCVRREFLTNYQVERLLKGEREGFFFGDYLARYYIGAGPMARVYRSVHRKSGQGAAVKVLRRRYSARESHVREFLRQGEIGRSLDHPSIVSVCEVGTQGRTHFVAMEFVEGHNLREFIKIRKRIDPGEATRMIVDVTDGLAYALEQGHRHRDLKPTNVLISSRGHAKVADFGPAIATERAGYAAAGEGEAMEVETVDYAALERATEVPKDDPRSDIFFLGCMYYHMLTGVGPLEEAQDRVQRGGTPRFSDIVPVLEMAPELPQAVAAIVDRAMSLDADARYQTPSLMHSELKLAAKRLSGEVEDDAERPGKKAIEAVRPRLRRTIMVVESDGHMQNIFRTGLRKAGYRVLLTKDPDRAVDRFIEDPKLADGLLINAEQVGEDAVLAFNRLGLDNRGQMIPTILLLDEGQHEWKEGKGTNTSKNRVVMFMPLKMKQLRETLARLVPLSTSEADR
jgi:serine/threonine-protein kinase